jgi:hypothetical protein
MTERENFRKQVNILLEEYTGGNAFFDKLDEEITQKITDFSVAQEFLKGLNPKHIIVVSGKFGRKFELLFGKQFNIISISGGLRANQITQTEKEVLQQQIGQTSWTFIDDSFYQGRTYGKIANAIGHHASLIKVFYDGSFFAPYQLESWFRYHPHPT